MSHLRVVAKPDPAWSSERPADLYPDEERVVARVAFELARGELARRRQEVEALIDRIEELRLQLEPALERLDAAMDLVTQGARRLAEVGQP
jgi:exonuclease VII small subunit